MRLKKPLSGTLIIAFLTLIILEATPTMINSSAPSPFVDAATSATYIKWSGYTWLVRNSNEKATNPGPNYWSNSTQNVWLDSNGYLHLKITQRNGKWYCAEVTCTQPLGYGTYAFYTIGRIDQLDQNVVLGLFAYKDDTHEIDIEFAKWGDASYPNSWFSVQPPPFIAGVNQKTFNLKLYGSYTTHYFTYKPQSVYFETFAGHYPVGTEPASNVIAKLTCNKSVDLGDAKANINFWLYRGNAPSNGQPVEVVIKSFQFIPLN
ncbi:MAG: hypothetical protein NWE92_04815 [Candidatus Bathyarchaeota archaeon]|nr:hypothetical protein [Candidatus Bathyarchaeota archaeon]